MRRDNNKWRHSLLALAASLLSLQTAIAEDWQTEEMHGQLYVHGALLASACGLTMDSATQEVWLGETGTASLQHPGAQGKPINFILRLTDCISTPAFAVDEKRASKVWSQDQPAILVNFNANTDANMTTLVSVTGVSGLALQLDDLEGQKVPLNERHRPVLVSPGGNELIYTVTPVRTPAALTPGAWRAVINFGIRYE